MNAMNYAIDNGANIINLSLGKSQFAYSANFDAVIKKAASKNIITVIASGN
ncbi:MAG: S8 family serine peptidase [Patescibacteria group bacterium]